MSERYEPSRTVFYDMDGVVAGFDAEAIRRTRLTTPGFTGDRPRTNFYLADDYPEHAEAIRAVCAEPGFFRELPLLEGALEAWQRTLDYGLQPRILSSPLRTNATSEQDKRAWLADKYGPVFGEHVARDAIITKNKHLHDGIALIDDRPVIPYAHEASWSHVVAHYPHNEHVDTDLRLYGLTDERLEAVLDLAWERYVRKLGARAL